MSKGFHSLVSKITIAGYLTIAAISGGWTNSGLCGHSALPTFGPGPPPSIVPVTRHYMARPTIDDIAQVYPRRTLRIERSGAAEISCIATASGTLKDCFTICEEPLDEGFGRAALSLAPLFKMTIIASKEVHSTGGRVVAGARVVIPIRFALPRT